MKPDSAFEKTPACRDAENHDRRAARTGAGRARATGESTQADESGFAAVSGAGRPTELGAQAVAAIADATRPASPARARDRPFDQ